MTNKEIKEKYGIELILKEGWCWNDHKSEAEKCFCLKKDSKEIPYVCYLENHMSYFFKNFSETNPNSKEPQVGDWGWFFGSEEYGAYFGQLISIRPTSHEPFHPFRLGWWKHFSHEKPSFLP